ncbi:hypothetical protein GCM10027194_35740 [Thalassiella azotivora]
MLSSDRSAVRRRWPLTVPVAMLAAGCDALPGDPVAIDNRPIGIAVGRELQVFMPLCDDESIASATVTDFESGEVLWAAESVRSPGQQWITAGTSADFEDVTPEPEGPLLDGPSRELVVEVRVDSGREEDYAFSLPLPDGQLGVLLDTNGRVVTEATIRTYLDC